MDASDHICDGSEIGWSNPAGLFEAIYKITLAMITLGQDLTVRP